MLSRILTSRPKPAGWTVPGEKKDVIPWIQFTTDTPLQIKTDSEIGTDSTLFVRFKLSGFEGRIQIDFLEPQLKVSSCLDDLATFALSAAPDDVRVWTFEFYSTAFSIKCNGESIVDFKYSDFSSESCATWAEEVTHIVFNSFKDEGVQDTASDLFRHRPTGEVIYRA